MSGVWCDVPVYLMGAWLGEVWGLLMGLAGPLLRTADFFRGSSPRLGEVVLKVGSGLGQLPGPPTAQGPGHRNGPVNAGPLASLGIQQITSNCYSAQMQMGKLRPLGKKALTQI